MRFTILNILGITAICGVLFALVNGPTQGNGVVFVLFIAMLMASVVIAMHLQFYLTGRLIQFAVRTASNPKMLRRLIWVFNFRRVAIAINDASIEHIARGEFRRGLHLLSIAIEITKDEAAFWINRGYCYQSIDEFQKAIEDYSKAIELDSSNTTVHGRRGYAFFRLHKYEEAIEDFHRYPLTNAGDALIGYCFGISLENQKQWCAAMEKYRIACEMDPSYWPAIAAFARLQSCCPLQEIRDGFAAVQNAERAWLLVQQRDWTVASVLAAAYAESGDFRQSIALAQIAVNLAPDEEKASRVDRQKQYEAGVPFRIGGNDE